MAVLTLGQVKATVSELRKKTRQRATAYAIHSGGGWNGPSTCQIEGEEHLLMPCCSDLQARESLILGNSDGKPVILLCSVDILGEDVLERVAKRRIVRPQDEEVLLELFGARVIDRRILAAKELTQALIERAPGGTQYRQVVGGTLDLETAWASLLEQSLGKNISGPACLLELGSDAAKTIRAFKPDLLKELKDWLSRKYGESVVFIMAAIESGHVEDLVPLGLALGLVFSVEFQAKTEFHAAQARLEAYFQGRSIDTACARVWARTAEEVVKRLDNREQLVLLRRLDEVLADLKIEAFASISSFSIKGFGDRFNIFGERLTMAIDGSLTVQEANASLEDIRQHLLASGEQERIERCEMALRLTNGLKRGELFEKSEDLQSLIEFYSRSGGFIYWARNRLLEADVSEKVQSAYKLLLNTIHGKLINLEEKFAEKLGEWTKAEQHSNRFICIEDVLDCAVIPLAKENPVLLLVLDGMSMAVFRQMVRDIERGDWVEIVSELLPRPVIATLPSLTLISRRALLLGRLEPAKSGTEKGEFGGNDILFQATGGQVRPKLFLKGDLTEEGHGELSSEVKKTILEKKCRLVSVVVNAIDDHLDSGDQVIFTWGVNRIKPLKELLYLARESGRLLIVTSDHGHVLDVGSKLLSNEGGEAGDRYRIKTSAIKPGEMVFEGTRIQKAIGKETVTLTWKDDIRYGPKKRGYHGGVNPQEIVIPMAILKHSALKLSDSWTEVPTFEPSWWRLDAPIATAAKTPNPKKKVDSSNFEDLPLFATIGQKQGEESKSWIDSLTASPIFLNQLKLAVRGQAPRELVPMLEAIDSRNGTIMKEPLAQAIGVPLMRVSGIVQNVIRILNVEGFEVLSIDSNSETIKLNRDLLKKQFELK